MLEVGINLLGEALRKGPAFCCLPEFFNVFGALAQAHSSHIVLPLLERDSAAFYRRADQPWEAGLMFGQSAIVHPDGTVSANAGHYEGIALNNMPFAWQRQHCGGYPAEPVRHFLREDRRPDIYGE